MSTLKGKLKKVLKTAWKRKIAKFFNGDGALTGKAGLGYCRRFQPWARTTPFKRKALKHGIEIALGARLHRKAT